MQGLHLTADLSGCHAGLPVMTQPAALRTLCLAAVRASGLLPVGELFHVFAPHDGQPSGVTGVVLLAESHLAVHTWPELGAVTLDAYVCNLAQDNSAKAEALVQALIGALAPAQVSRQALRRGAPPEPSAPPALPGPPRSAVATRAPATWPAVKASSNTE